MKELHPLQRKLLNLLLKTVDDPLTIREIQEKLNVSSTSVIAHHLRQLEKKGHLKRNPNNPRDYQILSNAPEKPITYLNLYRLAHCGPTGSILDGNPIDRIPISTQLLSFPSSEAFMVKVKGDSMAPKINEGDFVTVRKTNDVPNGAVAVCVNDGEALIKKIQKENDQVILISYNLSYPPFLAANDFKIEGEVRGIITSKLE